jgi:hypothetical protein
MSPSYWGSEMTGVIIKEDTRVLTLSLHMFKKRPYECKGRWKPYRSHLERYESGCQQGSVCPFSISYKTTNFTIGILSDFIYTNYLSKITTPNTIIIR